MADSPENFGFGDTLADATNVALGVVAELSNLPVNFLFSLGDFLGGFFGSSSPQS